MLPELRWLVGARHRLCLLTISKLAKVLYLILMKRIRGVQLDYVFRFCTLSDFLVYEGRFLVGHVLVSRAQATYHVAKVALLVDIHVDI
jgi:hypothetical protein